ncbi:MFS transporter [Marinactinospora rubrisoli]|uniref:MFS transporter n=1 Tax=Marinactinospora rubrisoli TaxID=2715399 RepID=A0ABW2KC13_9ACTN
MSETAPSGTSTPATPRRAPAWLGYTGVYLLLFLIGTETFLVSPLLPTIAADLDVSEVAAAHTVTAYTLAYAAGAPFLGALSDRFGRHPTIVAGAALFCVSNVVAGLAPSLAMLIAARVLGALGAAMAGPSIWAHLAETSPEESRGRAIGTGMALFAAGQVFGVPAGGFSVGLGGWPAPFLLLALLSAIAVAGVAAQTRPGRWPDAPRPGGTDLRAVLTVWADGTLRHVLVTVLFLQAANLGAYTFLGVVLHARFGLTVDQLGLLGILVGAGSFAGSLAAGRLGDRARRLGRSGTGLVVLWCALLAAGVAVAALGAPLWVCLAAVMVWFFASGAFGTDVQTLLINLRPRLGATSSSWNTACLYIGAGAGTWAVGLVADQRIGMAAVGGALAGVAALLAAGLAPRVRRGAAVPPSGPDEA